MELNTAKIQYSKADLCRGLKLPINLTEELAEDIGIMIGDGHIGKYIRKGRIDYVIQCSGNLITDWEYYAGFVRVLKKNLFNLDFSVRETKKNTLKFKINSRGLLEFYTKIIKLPLGRKTDITIPAQITKNEKLMIACIRGIIDTDGSLVFRKKDKNINYYPLIKLSCASQQLIKQISKFLSGLGYKVTNSFNLHSIQPKTGTITIGHELHMNGKKNLEKWISEIGFNNPKNLLKYRLWKQKGFCPPDQEIRLKMYGPRGKFASTVSNPRPRYPVQQNALKLIG